MEKSTMHLAMERIANFQSQESKLSKQEVNLSVLDDIDSKESKGQSKSLEATKLIQQAIMSASESAEAFAWAENLADKAIPQAKELGAKALVKQLTSSSKNNGNKKKFFNKLESKLKALI